MKHDNLETNLKREIRYVERNRVFTLCDDPSTFFEFENNPRIYHLTWESKDLANIDAIQKDQVLEDYLLKMENRKFYKYEEYKKHRYIQHISQTPELEKAIKNIYEIPSIFNLELNDADNLIPAVIVGSIIFGPAIGLMFGLFEQDYSIYTRMTAVIAGFTPAILTGYSIKKENNTRKVLTQELKKYI